MSPTSAQIHQTPPVVSDGAAKSTTPKNPKGSKGSKGSLGNLTDSSSKPHLNPNYLKPKND